ncbi:serine kinase [Stutzerimonas stutzeri ATCC 14405 = CCUG 16156]|nr:serine kinase [Stutzerimonas stutzeri ATCC 14405 = CCUG 16156]
MMGLSALRRVCANPMRAFKVDGEHGSRSAIAVTCSIAMTEKDLQAADENA